MMRSSKRSRTPGSMVYGGESSDVINTKLLVEYRGHLVG
jgi:hypothetical protein